MEVSVIILQNHLIIVLRRNKTSSWVSSPTNTSSEKKYLNTPAVTHYFYRFCPFLARSAITRTVLGKYMGGGAESPPQNEPLCHSTT